MNAPTPPTPAGPIPEIALTAVALLRASMRDDRAAYDVLLADVDPYEALGALVAAAIVHGVKWRGSAAAFDAYLAATLTAAAIRTTNEGK